MKKILAVCVLLCVVTLGVTSALADITPSSSTITLDEGTTVGFTVSLTTVTQDTTLTLARAGDVYTTVSPVVLFFTTATYATTQTVTVTATELPIDYNDKISTFSIYGSAGDTPTTVTVVVTSSNTGSLPTSVLSTSTLVLDEGTTTSLTMALSGTPGVTTTFTLTRSGDTYTTVSPVSLVFTTANYATTQTVTITAASLPIDYTDKTTTYTISAESGNTTITSSAFVITALDTLGPFSPDINLIPGPLASGDEDGNVSITAKLSASPGATTVLTIAKASGSTDHTQSTGPTYTYTTGNFASAQTITFALADSAETTDQNSYWTITATSGNTVGIAAQTFRVRSVNVDPVGSPNLSISDTTPSVAEGGSTVVTVVLDGAPWVKSGATDLVTTYTVARASGDTQITVLPATLLFTPSNYATSQSVTLSSAWDRFTYTAHNAVVTLTPSSGDTGTTVGTLTVTSPNSGFYGNTVAESSYTLTYQNLTLDTITTPAAGVVATFKYTGWRKAKRFFKVWNLDTTSALDIMFNDVSGDRVAESGGDVSIAAEGNYIVTTDTGLMPDNGILGFSCWLADKSTPTLRVRGY